VSRAIKDKKSGQTESNYSKCGKASSQNLLALFMSKLFTLKPLKSKDEGGGMKAESLAIER
jgi:hypothetical protein